MIRCIFTTLAILLMDGPLLADSDGSSIWLTSNVLRWSPPALTHPIVIPVPIDFYSATLDLNTDYILKMPSSCRNSDMQTSGGRNIRIVGGCNSGGANGSRMAFTNVMKSVFLEGISFKMGREEDVINVGGTNASRPDVYLQNIRVTGARGSFASNHTDIFQAHGPVGTLYIHRLTGDSNYQGIFDSGEFPQTATYMSMVNLRYNNIKPAGRITYLLWFGTSDITKSATPEQRLASLWPRYLTEVYVDTTLREQSLECCGVQPAVGATLNGTNVAPIMDGAGNVAAWPPTMQITGGVRAGSPKEDFVLSGRSRPGARYVSPGYSN
jgi:hypothetical protein